LKGTVPLPESVFGKHLQSKPRVYEPFRLG
jgi:hypothetical protein